MVHLGVGAFFRAHQAWFTAHAADGGEWGIAAFTGRSAVPAALVAQDGVYSLVERGPSADRVELIANLVEVRPGDDLDGLCRRCADPQVAVVTMTVTESGYALTAAGDPAPPLVADILALRDGQRPRTAVARLVAGLDARRRAGAGPIAVVPCDNLPANGEWLRRGLRAASSLVGEALADWVDENVSVVSTSVDRITPQPSGEVEAVRRAGWADGATVVTEPFADWVLQGAFPAGRPAWETVGARFVDNIAPWENRKLWLLNGAHSILASLGWARGHATVHEAIADPVCRDLVERYWAEAVQLLDVEHVDYRAALLERFENPRMADRLERIAVDAATKTGVRAGAVALRLRETGRFAEASVEAVRAWVAAVRGGFRAADARDPDIDRALAAPDSEAALLAIACPALAARLAVPAD